MKTLICRIPDGVAEGDLVILCYRDKLRGGRTDVKHVLRGMRYTIDASSGFPVEHAPDTRADVARELLDHIKSSTNGWLPEFETKLKGDDTLIIHCAGAVQHCDFEFEVEYADKRSSDVTKLEAI